MDRAHATAKAFAREGAKVAGFDLGRKIDYPAYAEAGSEGLNSLQREIAEQGGEFLPLTGDIRNETDISATVARTIETFGRIDVVFGNAGIAAYGYAHELTESEWDAVLDINLKGNWLLAKHVIPHLQAQRSGVIIFNSSIAGCGD
jgi:NAD(P)-dependent dehydrogenase (short-subunit alcohol dehydrogenase family)